MQRRLPPAFSLEAVSHPILSCADAADWEERLLSEQGAVWAAMSQVGEALGRAIRLDYGISRMRQSGLSALALVGKGHNGGDALLALENLAKAPGLLARVTVALSGELEDLKPHTRQAFDQLERAMPVRRIGFSQLADELATERYDLCLDGLLGMQFKPPLRESAAEAIRLANESDRIGCRIAIDLPSGVGDESDANPFRADFTYATGIFKQPLLDCLPAGTLRYLDVGFFRQHRDASYRVLTDQALQPLRVLRPSNSDKRRHGHLAVVAGSRSMPGALAMSVEAAIQSGVGLVTVFAPESVVAQMATRMPEAMWRPWPETPEGGLALEGLWQIRSIADKATALLLGPGMGSEKETHALLLDIVSEWREALVLDADALTQDIVERLGEVGNEHSILTPHAGEFKRISGGSEATDKRCVDFASERGLTLIKKGSATRIMGDGQLYLCPRGNAVLARGGSGDLLAGLTAGLLAQFPAQPREAACMSVYWHGKAADLLGAAKGQTAVRTTDLLDFLAPALEDGDAWNPLSPPGARPSGP